MNTKIHYLPTLPEIRLRAEVERYMRDHAWPLALMIFVMIYDNPTPDSVKRMIDAKGDPKAIKDQLLSLPGMKKETLEEFYSVAELDFEDCDLESGI